ncbi:GEVED domain-containing protein [Flavobacterium sp. MFBS3-15]|uniref:Ig-like domain-containing protein n=1 Tax=Flavobacterium sp. MFBS3-15 TaxID=2989816 RepID=UPI00223626D0|nr:GEVED domain-containing protein [Flavobacterium sp. MFBS3-15]MCW4470750.1 GEVED domain-containing protein [Flavobacterium sp. MFBS3-15]
MRFWHFCLVLYALFSVTAGQGQTGTVEIGSGTTSNSYLMPAYTNYGYNYTQQIVKASEYSASGGVAGNITKIRFYVGTLATPVANWNSWTVYVGHTAKNSFASTTDWEPVANLTQVFSGTITPVGSSWMEITFTTPFAYNGTSNLIVAVDENSANWSTGDTYWGSYTGSTDTAIYYRNDTTNPNPATPPTATGRTNLLARIQFFGAVAPCLAPTGVNIPTVTTTGATIGWAASASAPSAGYEYYYSASSTAPTSGTTPSGSVGAGVLTAPISGLTPNTPYYVWVRGNCGTDGVSAWTAVAGFTTACDPQDIPYTQDFESVTTPALPACTSVQAISGNAWATNSPAAYGFTNKALRYAYSTSAAANSWFFTKGLNLTAGTSYRITYKYGSAGFTEKMKVMYGTAPSAASMTLPIADHTSFSTSPLNNTVDFTPAASGVYYFGFHAYSAANQFWIFLDDINITVSPTCFSPTALTSAVVSTTSGTVSWTAPTPAPANGYEYYTSTTNTAPTAGTTASGTVGAGVTTATLGSLAPNTTNYVWVRSVCSGSDKSAWSGPTSFYTGYCTPAPTSVDGTGITNVTIGGVNNATAGEAGNYGNYSAMVANGNIGSTVNFSITFNTCAGTTCYTYGTKIWVDWNNDLDFTDAGELVYTGLSGNVTPIILSGSFTIPANASLAGNHRMRIGATDTDSGPSGPCYADTYGSFEDYTLNAVLPPAPVVTSFTPATACAAVSDLIITGTDLGNATVTVGGTPVTVTPTTSTTQIVAVVPAGVSGVVAVTTVSGTFTTVNTFTVTAPTAITLSAASDTVCAGQASDVVTITAGASAFDTFEWSPLAGVSGNATTGFTFSPAATTTYTLTASNTVSGCVTTTTFTVNVNVLPSALVLPDAASVCEGGSAVAIAATGGTTVATILSENFNAATNNWTTVNNSTGGTVANAAWTLRPNGYTIPGYNPVESNDDTQFYLSNSDSQGNGSTTSVILRSPSFSTVGYASATVAFHHFYQQWQTSTAKVEASTDGTTWTTLQTYSANTGGYTAFAAGNVPLTAPFLNQPVVYIRFKFDAAWGYFWAIDNVSISGQQGADITWAPQAGLYTDAAATMAYTGQPMATVYARPTATTTYTATATNPFGCSISDTVEVTHISTPAPAANAAQSVCSGATITGLVATGTAIKWYAAATGGTQLAGTTALVNGTTYYASQTANGCESVMRTPVTVTVNVTAAPTVANDIQSFCNAGTVSQLVATGTNVQWYAAATGGTALAGTTAFPTGTTVYYASQTLNGCESPSRTAVAVVVNVTAAPSAAATQTFCNSGTVAGLMASGTGVQWYADATGGTALAGTTALIDGGMYYASQTVGGCESATRTMVTVDFTTPAAPDAAATQTFCNSATVADLDAAGEITWYAAETGGNALASSEALTNGGVYYASQWVEGCESMARTMVTVTLTTPAAPDAAATQTFCNGATVADLTATGTAGADITWYASATGGSALSSSTALTNGGMYYASQTVVGCESATRAMVTVAFNATVAPVAMPLQSFCNSATVADLMATGDGIQWYAAATGGTALDAGAELNGGMLYYASQTIDGCESMQRATVVVSITTVDDLTGESQQSFSAGVAGEVTLEDLVVDGYQGYVTWYATEEEALNGGTPLPAGTELETGATYYGIQTIGQCSSEGAFSVTVEVTLDGAHFDTAAFQYHPNPVKDMLNVSYSSDITSIAVFNMLGQQVISVKPAASQTKVDMSGLADGTYVMKVTAGEAVKTIKVVKKQ